MTWIPSFEEMSVHFEKGKKIIRVDYYLNGEKSTEEDAKHFYNHLYSIDEKFKCHSNTFYSDGTCKTEDLYGSNLSPNSANYIDSNGRKIAVLGSTHYVFYYYPSEHIMIKTSSMYGYKNYLQIERTDFKNDNSFPIVGKHKEGELFIMEEHEIN